MNADPAPQRRGDTDITPLMRQITDSLLHGERHLDAGERILLHSESRWIAEKHDNGVSNIFVYGRAVLERYLRHFSQVVVEKLCEVFAYRHGLRASELVALRWDDIDFQTGKLHVRRAKGGTASVHPIGGRELRALRRLKREAPAGVYVFVSERLAPLSVAGYQRMVARAGEAAGFPFLVHSHMLRHSCGYKLANDGQDTRAIQHYLGHKSINSTVRYTALAPDRFKGFWKD